MGSVTLPASYKKGDRVVVRDRLWTVDNIKKVNGSVALITLHPLEPTPSAEPLTVLSPPDELTRCPGRSLVFDPNGLDTFPSWRRNHLLLDAVAHRGTDELTGIQAGRVFLHAYQLAPVKKILAKPRPSLLIADDVGLGKTIEAGLCLLELIARGLADRILIVVPPGLIPQWQEELEIKFGLSFSVIEDAGGLAREQTGLPAGLSPWEVLPRILTSLEYLKKEEVIRRALKVRWDVVVADEAHLLAQSGTPANPYRTKRTRLGERLRDAARSLLLLTATPHNGYSHSYRSLIELVEPTYATFKGSDEDRRRRAEGSRIRRLKSQIQRRAAGGKWEPVFPKRTVEPIPVKLSQIEKDLFQKISSYCARTSREAAGTEYEDLVSFAMQIIKKRMLSSRRALERTVENRLRAIEKPDEREVTPEPSDLRELRADMPMSEERAERIRDKIIRSAMPKDEALRKIETRQLKEIRKILKSCPARDPKIDALIHHVRELLKQNPAEKLIVFTEYLDTLESIVDAIQKTPDLKDHHLILKGGMTARQRQRIQRAFETADVRLLLATDAASEGLNLQRACHRIVHVEVPWNPNRLEQRNGRVDRYGQTRPPVIRYLWYPASPEDDMLGTLIGKIEEMHRERVSTPDILGILAGADFFETSMVRMDPAQADIPEQKSRLVQTFDDRVQDFLRDVQPLLVGDPTDQRSDVDPIDATEIRLSDDVALERLVIDALNKYGPRARNLEDGVFRIAVPSMYCDRGVEREYRRATFRRSLAVHTRPDELVFITSAHPLVQALAAAARKTLLQVYPESSGAARRLAARSVKSGEPPSVLFTFYVQFTGLGFVEEKILPVRMGLDGQVKGELQDGWKSIRDETTAGEVSTGALEKIFSDRFDDLRSKADDVASRHADKRLAEISAERGRLADELERQLKEDEKSRRAELKEFAKQLSVEKEEVQPLLFDRPVTQMIQPETVTGAQIAAIQTFVNQRKEEIKLFRQVTCAVAPAELGALFLVPEEFKSK